MSTEQTVRVGQVWQDCDQRNAQDRYVRVTAIEDEHGRAVCEAWYDVLDSRRRTVRIRLDRFRPTSTGYRLISEPADGGS